MVIEEKLDESRKNCSSGDNSQECLGNEERYPSDASESEESEEEHEKMICWRRVVELGILVDNLEKGCAACVPFQIQCFLKINYFPIEGGTAELECTSHETFINQHVSWINPQNEIVSNCSFPGYCTIPTDPRIHVTGRNETSTLRIHRAAYTVDNGVWYCVFNTYQSFERLYIISKPAYFSFLNPPPYGKSISKNSIHLISKADCIYPEPKYIDLKYRIKGNGKFNIFQLRRPKYQYITNTSLCRDHETSINITIHLYKDDFHKVIVFFKFSYTTLSGHTFSTTDVVGITFPGSSTACHLNPCQHNGSCLESGECNCSSKFTGSFCEDAISNEGTILPRSSTTVISTVSTTDGLDENVLYIILVLIAIFLLGFGCVCWFRYKGNNPNVYGELEDTTWCCSFTNRASNEINTDVSPEETAKISADTTLGVDAKETDV
ncbi:uncharacterized protein LOC125682762 [Ostrea edulis]|uniref:uncharacterized protein LOC125682762 n=1 Tax=Ostrea edulis TaxID=37623 RepID=UPI0024AF1D17|nr:uncharacterized protein LOC125682762 [Ostrea edulis]